MQSPFFNKALWVNENASAFALRDAFPISAGHTLIVPKRDVNSILELDDQELLDCWQLLREEQKKLQADLRPDGFNIGINIGEAAGQTVHHPHIHLIPRFRGDHPDPRGGVRAVIPGKATYEK